MALVLPPGQSWLPVHQSDPAGAQCLAGSSTVSAAQNLMTDSQSRQKSLESSKPFSSEVDTLMPREQLDIRCIGLLCSSTDRTAARMAVKTVEPYGPFSMKTDELLKLHYAAVRGQRGAQLKSCLGRDNIGY